MWRRAPYTSSMPVPTYPSEDSKSHAHSPRRRDQVLPGETSTDNKHAVQGMMTNRSGNVSFKQDRSFNASGTIPNLPPGFEQIDPLENPCDYLQWLGSADASVIESSQPLLGPYSNTRKLRKTSTDISMPDYAPSAYERPIPISGDSLLTQPSLQVIDGGNTGYVKAPTNTPTTGGHLIIGSEATPFPIMPNPGVIPFGLANTLTSSLLNQSMPSQFGTPNLPSTVPEVRSRKETRSRRSNPYSTACFAPITIQEDDDNISQQAYVPSAASVTVSAGGSQTRAPKPLTSSELNQRTPSTSKSSDTLANADGQEKILESVQTSSDKNAKRARHYTPGPTQVLDDDEDGLLRGSPRIRLTPFTEDTPPIIPAS
ncbi:hypothetical protein BGZ63DRAFT_402910 [Mariannaea sp. PMI_226]|nr:hypothetical protein BGZ63DRAFT_402910 [Mariannaea sp. PMI_226]